MFDRALLAMQKIKDSYGVNFAEYDDVLRRELLVQRQVSEEAETALGEHQFDVYYQPKFDLHGNRTDGAEALVRWNHPALGFMSPGVFIPLFEKNGFIQNVDYYVWEAVCRDIREWKEKGMRLVPISVNVSRRDFEDEHLAEKVIALLERYGIEREYFHIEFTESAYSDNPQLISQTVHKFHDNGFVVELDDFGAGYSSMSALSDLDLDIMKLDMSLIRKDDPNSSRSVLEFSMQLAKILQLKTVAEGVETEEQKNRIASLGGDYIQGFYYSKPLPREQFEEHLLQERA
jgi:EAL domain-containing protein (putative c-di-GMP-specific phosphodiesterase class I)